MKMNKNQPDVEKFNINTFKKAAKIIKKYPEYRCIIDKSIDRTYVFKEYISKSIDFKKDIHNHDIKYYISELNKPDELEISIYTLLISFVLVLSFVMLNLHAAICVLSSVLLPVSIYFYIYHIKNKQYKNKCIARKYNEDNNLYLIISKVDNDVVKYLEVL